MEHDHLPERPVTAPTPTTAGPARADVAASYTPGAGNVW